MQKREIIERILELPDNIRVAEMVLLEKRNAYYSLKEEYERKGEVESNRSVLKEAEKEMHTQKIMLNRLQNEFTALQSVALLLSKE